MVATQFHQRKNRTFQDIFIVFQDISEFNNTFRVEPRVAIKIPKIRLKVATKLLGIFGIEAQSC